jgi:predicted ester cyclase
MATTLSPNEMKEFVRRHFEDFVNQQKPEVIRRNMTAGFLDHDGPGGKETGIQGDEDMMRAMYRIFPDLHVDIDEMIAEKDKVVCRNRWHGTSAQTGKRMEFHGFVEWRFEGDRIAERWATVTAPAEIQ